MRKEPQVFWDAIALLNLLKAANEAGRADGNTKLQKMTFLSELKGKEEGLRTAHYRFFRYTYGPYSPTLSGDVERLEELGFITKSSRKLTKRGEFLVEYVSDAIRHSATAVRAIDIIQEIAKTYARSTGTSLMNRVYGMTVQVHDLGGDLRKIRDVPMFLDILDPECEPLNEVQPFGDELLHDLKAEFAIPPENLELSSRSFQQTLTGALSGSAAR